MRIDDFHDSRKREMQWLETHKLSEKGWITFGDTLLSRPEQESFVYYLNRQAGFGNSLDLRSHYLHGTEEDDPNNDSYHQQSRVRFLKLMMILIIKINDELCLRGETAC